jgi:D-alanine-D-alanine ligase
MRVAILHDDVWGMANPREDEQSVLHVVDAVATALDTLGHDARSVAVDAESTWIAELSVDRPDLVFNLCEGVGGEAALEPAASGVLDLLRIPYTGCTTETLAFARRKDRVNAALAAAGLPVPAWTQPREGGIPSRWRRYPSIVKPTGEDASVGIHQTSVVRDAAELKAALRATPADLPVLIQEYVPGREFNVGFIGQEPLPVSEIEFDGMPEDLWRIVSWNAKWSPGSPEDLGSVACCPARIDFELCTYLTNIALMAWRAVEGRGYGRVDLRLDSKDRGWILEVNPNPDLSLDAGLTRMAGAAGLSYTDLIGRIVAEAMA